MTPRHDVSGGRKPASLLSEARLRFAREIARRRRPRAADSKGQPGADPCPVDPNRPLDLSGDAAAALTFDD